MGKKKIFSLQKIYDMQESKIILLPPPTHTEGEKSIADHVASFLLPS